MDHDHAIPSPDFSEPSQPRLDSSSSLNSVDALDSPDAPREQSSYPPYPSPEERLAEVQAMLEADLAALLGELSQGPSEHLRHFLDFSALFYHYSPTNQLLIALQRPGATRVAGFKAWEALGYHVAKGEKGIKIIVPIAQKITQIDPETGEEKAIEGPARAFTTGAVFDVSQLREDELAAHPLPVFFESLGDDPFHLAERIEQVIVEDGISIEENAHSQALGYSRGGVIGIRSDLDEATRAQTLIHEYAHEKMHQGQASRSILPEIREMHAEAVTYIVCRHFGLQSPQSADYLTLYGATPKDVLREMRSILLCSSKIIEAIHRLDAEDEGAHRHRL